MELNDLATVELPELGTYKFVVTRITNGRESKYVLVGNPNCDYHNSVYNLYRASLPQTVDAEEPIGGGRIRMTERELYAYGYSGSYGEPPQSIVEELLRQYAENKKLSLRVEIGTGY